MNRTGKSKIRSTGLFTALLINLAILSGLSGQNIDQTYHYACEKLTGKDFNEAIPSFRRVLFFDSAHLFNECYYKLGECYSENNNYPLAQYYFNLAYSSTFNDSIKTEVVFHKVHLYIMSKEYEYAKLELLNLSPLSQYFQDKYNFYSGIIAFQQGKYDQAEENFIKVVPGTDSALIFHIDSLFVLLKKSEKRNPKSARNLSILLPGLGQLYAGYPAEALNSFLLNSFFIILYTSTIRHYSLLDGLIAVAPWFERYYIGGFFKAEKLVDKKKEEKRNEIYKALLNYIK